MNPQEHLSCLNNELAPEQAYEIIDIFKSIKKALSCKFTKSAKQFGFTPPQLSVIFHLYEIPSITLNELSDHMGLTKSTVSGIVDRLSNQGVVIREIPKNNRRIVKLSISEEFRKNNDIGDIKKSFLADLITNNIKNMDSEEVEKMIYGLRQFNLLVNNDSCE